jgi:ATP-dependent helicase/nuclease subunit A
MKLTPQQDAAIHRTGQDVCVIAGPGSGKTRVLAERFAWLVNDMGISPRNILALTFTEKAAKEIQARVAKTKHPDIDFAPISTLHGLCKRVLSEFAIAAGLDPATTVWDERVAQAELRGAVEQVLNDAARRETAQLRKLFETWNSSALVEDLCAIYGRIRALSREFPRPEAAPEMPAFWQQFLALGEDVVAQKPTTAASAKFHAAFVAAFREFAALGDAPGWEHVAALEEFPKRGNLPGTLKEAAASFYGMFEAVQAVVVTSLVTPERNYLILLIARIAERYEARKLEVARMDFNDLEHRTIALLENNAAVREELQRRFEFILMDEMQDTNPIQWELLELLRSPGNFFAVGDVNQSIYGFRFAAPREFVAYRDGIVAAGGEIDFLGDNFRSRGEILTFTEAVSAGLSGIEPPGLRAGRAFQTANVPVSLHGFEKPQQEYEWIAEEIAALRGSFVVEPKGGGALRRLELSDIAILVRTANKGEAIGAVLAEHGIPFALGGGRQFFETQEVADCVSYLELLANPLNTIARAAVMRSPLVGLSDDDLLEQRTDGAFEAMLARHRALRDETCPDRFIAEAMDRVAYLETLNAGGRANVEKMLRIIREVWSERPRNMREMVEEISHMRQAAQEKSAPVSGLGEAVQILTVHASKGLEFPVVFVANALFHSPANRASLLFAAPSRIGVRWTNPVNGKAYADQPARIILDELKREDEEELQRQLYVALTRAEQRLYVSWAGTQKRGWYKWLAPHEATRFEGEEGAALLEQREARLTAEAMVVHPLAPQLPWISSATPTELSHYQQCPRRYFLDVVAGIVERDVAPAPAIELGMQVHSLLAGAAVEEPSEEAQELAAVARASALEGELAGARWVEREFDVLFAVDDLVIEGKIDLCFENEQGEIVIVDYKTNHRVSRDYDLQMALYREAMAKMYPGKAVRSYLHFLRPNVIVEATAPLDRNLLSRLQRGDRFEMQEGAHCARCPHVAGACPASGPADSSA